METAGTKLGGDLTRGLKKTDWNSGFSGLTAAAEKSSKDAAKSMGRVEDSVIRLAGYADEAGDSIEGNFDKAGHSADGFRAVVVEATKDVGDLKKVAKGIDLNFGGGRGGGGSRALRTAGDDAGYFLTKLNELASHAERSTKILTGLFHTAAFGGTAVTILVGGLSAAAQGLFVIGANAASALPAMAALTTGMLALGQAGATIGLAMKGVGAALSAGFKLAKDTATPAAAAAKKLSSVSRDGIKNAREALQAAKLNRDGIIAAQEAVQAAVRSIVDAKDALRDAYRDAGWAASDAARRTIRAEQELAAAQGKVTDAQQALNDARAEAIEQLEDIGFKAEDAALAEERAGLALEDAYARLLEVSELAPDNKTRQEAELAFKEAELNLRQAKDAREDADAAQAQAAASGIEGTQAMQDAHADLASAEADAIDAANDLADAQREQARTTIENAEAIQDAEQGLADARADHRGALVDLINAEREHAQAVKDAQDALKEALADYAAARAALVAQNAALAQTTPAFDAYAAAMKDLSPAQQEFVKRLVGLRDGFIEARKEIANPLFEGLNNALTTMLQGDLLGVLKKGLTETSATLGTFAEDAATAFNEDVFTSSLADVMDSNQTSIKNFGDVFINLADAFVQVADAASPLLEDFSEWLSVVTKGWSETSRLKNSTGELTEKFQDAANRLKEFWELGKQLWRTLDILGESANRASNKFGDLGRKGEENKDKFGYITTLSDNLKKFNDDLDKSKGKTGKFTQALETLNEIGGAFKVLIIDPFTKLGQDKGMEKAFKILGNKKTADAMDKLAENAGKAAPKLAKIVENLLELAAAMSDSGAIEHFLDILKKVTGWAADFAGWLGKIHLDKLNKAITKVADAISFLLDKVGLDSLSEWFDDIDAGGKSVLQLVGYLTGAYAAFKLLKTVGKIVASPIAKPVAKLAGGAKKLFGKAGDVTDASDNAQAKKDGKDITEAFADGIKAGMVHKDAAMKALRKNVEKELNKVLTKNRDNAIKVGTDLMEGLELGLREGAIEAVIKAADAGRDVAKAVGKGAGTHSPSTITFKDGNDVMEGLELGIKSGTAEAKLAASAAGRSVGTSVGNSAKAAVATSGAGIGPAMSTTATTSMGKSTGKMSGAMGKMMKPLTGVAKGFGGLMTFAMGPFGIALELIILLLPILIPLFKKIEEKTGIFSKTLEGVQNVLGWLWDKIKDLFGWVKDNWPLLLAILTGPIGLAVLTIIKHWDDIKAAVGAAVEWVTEKLTAIWDGITNGWDNIKQFFKDLWPVHIKPWIVGLLVDIAIMLIKLWNGITDGWTKIKQFFKDLWPVHIKPWIVGLLVDIAIQLIKIWNGIQDGWDKVTQFFKDLWPVHVKPWIVNLVADAAIALGKFWDAIQDKWGDLMTWLGGLWSGPNGLQKKISNIVDNVSGALSGIWDGMGEGAVSAWNWIAGFVNDKIIGGLNNILGFFNAPEIKFTLPENLSWTGFAEGGPIRGRGGPKADKVPILASNGEYMLPARSASKLGPETLEYMRRYGQLPPMGDPGIFGAIGHAFSTVADAVANGAETAVKWTFNKIIGGLPDTLMGRMLKGFVESLVDKVVAWAKGADVEAAAAAGGGGADVAVSDPSNPRGITVWKGGVFTRRFVAHMMKAEKLAGLAIRVIQGGFRPATSYSGTSHQGDALDTAVSYALIRALRRVGIAAGDRTGLGDWGPHIHAVPGPAAGYGAGSALWQWADYVARGGKNQALNSPWGLASGGTVAATPGGVMAMIAEGGRAERVTPLDREGFSAAERRMIELLEARLAGAGGGGGDTYNIHPSAPVDEANLASMVSRRVAWNRRRGARSA